MKKMMAALWVVSAGAIGLVAHVRSPGAVVVLAGLGFVPSLLLLLRWNEPQQTLSESIQKARR